MDAANVLSLLDQLDGEIDDLEESLAPLLKTVLSETASKLPLLDKAKLYALVTYAIESMLFSYLRLNGIKAREHPVFTELTRVKQYFDKIKVAETPITKRENLTLDKKAAGRFIAAGLSGNDKYDLQRAEQQAKERARAHIKFEELSKKIEMRNKPGETEVKDSSSVDSSDESDSESSKDVQDPQATPVVPHKKRKLEKTPNGQSDSNNTSEASRIGLGSVKLRQKRKKSTREKVRAKKQKKDSLK